MKTHLGKKHTKFELEIFNNFCINELLSNNFQQYCTGHASDIGFTNGLYNIVLNKNVSYFFSIYISIVKPQKAWNYGSINNTLAEDSMRRFNSFIKDLYQIYVM